MDPRFMSTLLPLLYMNTPAAPHTQDVPPTSVPELTTRFPV
jgi:hypothetical protein